MATSLTPAPTVAPTPPSRPRPSRGRRGHGRRSNPLGWLFSAPYLVYVAVIFAYPLGFAVYMSLHDYFFTAPGVEVERPFVGFVGTGTHWAFNRDVISGRRDRDGGYLSLVISGARGIVDDDNDVIAARTLADLRRLVPASAAAHVRHTQVVKEKFATMSPTVAAARTEPMPRTIVQKMTGLIIILMRLTNIVPRILNSLAESGATSPKTMPATTATMTARYSQWLRSRCPRSAIVGVSAGVAYAMLPSKVRRSGVVRVTP